MSCFCKVNHLEHQIPHKLKTNNVFSLVKKKFPQGGAVAHLIKYRHINSQGLGFKPRSPPAGNFMSDKTVL